jgi:cysteine desulfurase
MNAERPIYLDFQASTPVNDRVRVAMARAESETFANPNAEGHVFGWRARALIEEARGEVAAAIGSLPDEVIFTSGATEADNIGVAGAALGAPAERRRVIISAFEHKAVLESAYALERFGFSVEEIPVGPDGIVDLGHLERRLARDVAVVSVMAVNNEIGTVQPLARVSELTAPFGAFLHTDATQAPMAMAVDVLAWGTDAASFSGHKIYGPKGVGALYLSAAAPWRPRPLMFGGGQEQGLRPGTLPTGLCVGLGAAFRLVAEDEGARIRFAALRDELVSGLRAGIPGLQLTCEMSPRHPGVAHVRIPGLDSGELLQELADGVCAASGSACTSGVIGASHVLRAIGWDDISAREGLRLSVGYPTTEEDVEAAVGRICAAAERLIARAALH